MQLFPGYCYSDIQITTHIWNPEPKNLISEYIQEPISDIRCWFINIPYKRKHNIFEAATAGLQNMKQKKLDISLRKFGLISSSYKVKSKIKIWKPGCPYRLSKIYLQPAVFCVI